LILCFCDASSICHIPFAIQALFKFLQERHNAVQSCSSQAPAFTKKALNKPKAHIQSKAVTNDEIFGQEISFTFLSRTESLSSKS